jgi:hypothetical protein
MVWARSVIWSSAGMGVFATRLSRIAADQPVSEASASGRHLLGITRGGSFATLATIMLDAPDPALEHEAETILAASRTGNELATAIESTSCCARPATSRCSSLRTCSRRSVTV